MLMLMIQFTNNFDMNSKLCNTFEGFSIEIIQRAATLRCDNFALQVLWLHRCHIKVVYDMIIEKSSHILSEYDATHLTSRLPTAIQMHVTNTSNLPSLLHISPSFTKYIISVSISPFFNCFV